MSRQNEAQDATRRVLRQRLYTQRLAGERFAKPEEVVSSLGAMQSQDYGNARWSVGQRTTNSKDADVEAAFNDGRILRTHILRPTWHFVTPADIRWILQVTSPRIKALSAYMYRQGGLDDLLLGRSAELISSALSGGNQLTRTELAEVLARRGIHAEKVRLGYIVSDAELNGLICSGAVRGKQHTYALMEERAPVTGAVMPEDPLAELVKRFFAGHGPASIRDFSRWSSLPVAAAKHGLEVVRDELVSEEIKGETLWFSPDQPDAPPMDMTAFLLPEYDECVLTYPALGFPDASPTGLGALPEMFYRPIIIGDQRVGTWRRTIKKDLVTMEANLFTSLSKAQHQALLEAVDRYGSYIGKGIEFVISPNRLAG